MKIVHTADIHIAAKNDARWAALVEILRLCREQKADALVISGDLFDSAAAAQALRGQLRELFAECPFHTFIIPGNHDQNGFADVPFLGENVTIFGNLQEPVTLKDICFWGFPYEDLNEIQILQRLRQASGRTEAGKTHILLFHGELIDAAGDWSAYGEEGSRRYLPVRLSFFRDLGWQYILAGHFHSAFDVHRVRDNAYFVYPGSPIAITRREVGVRRVTLLEPGKAPRALPLKTPFFEHLAIHLQPYPAVNPVEGIRQALENLPPNGQLLLTVSGYFDGAVLGVSEADLHRQITETAGERAAALNLRFQDIGSLLKDDLYQLFVQKLEAETTDEDRRKRVGEWVIRAMVEAER